MCVLVNFYFLVLGEWLGGVSLAFKEKSCSVALVDLAIRDHWICSGFEDVMG